MFDSRLGGGHRGSYNPRPQSQRRRTLMRSIAVMNQKGGVGKTTTAVNLSAALAEAGQRVCIVDLDPQAHASLHLGVTIRDGQPSVYEVLIGELLFQNVRQQIADHLWLVPAHLDLAAAEVELA